MFFGHLANSSGGLCGHSNSTSGGSLFGNSSQNTNTNGSLFGSIGNNMAAGHICGLYFLEPAPSHVYNQSRRKYLPTISQSIHARIVASTSRTTLTQTYVNPSNKEAIPELRYTFPLFDGVSVVGFKCTINNDRVIHGVVQEKNTARKTYDKAVAQGETAGLFEQLPDASDVFTTTIGNVPAGAKIEVDITYLGELKHDAEIDGTRFTIPTSIAPRYGYYPGTLMEKPTNVSSDQGIQIVVDAEMPAGSVIKSIQSPSHPISVSVGSTSTMAANATPSLQFASATLSLGTTDLDKDFIVQIIATNTSNPIAILETHPTIPHQQAIMATLVPKFKLAITKPEIVFICDRSGSMGGKIDDLKNALRIYIKSLPVGCMFNICSFGSNHSFLFKNSKTYDQDTSNKAMKHIETFASNFGGTEMYAPIEQTFERRHKDLDLEVFVLTDGEIWNQEELFGMVNKNIEDSKGAVRIFTLGIGRNVSHSLIEGLARAGHGFSQSVSEQEKMSGKVVRMLKGALTPHVNDYSLEIKYADAESETEPEDDFEIIDSGSTEGSASEAGVIEKRKNPISLFDATSDDTEMEDADAETDGTGTDRFSHVPAVRPPKVLQAPFRIPPLYPYSRTSVYLLLSPERAMRDKTPESVILRGTSSQGPLELEIPITVLSEAGETIHQLAARKAVKELEEGRGWIYHAKGRDGELLEKSHPGRFSSMVEREAVRLGVGFQVGGKWCSFVAVEGSDKDIDDSGSNPEADDTSKSSETTGYSAFGRSQEDKRQRNTAASARSRIMAAQKQQQQMQQLQPAQQQQHQAQQRGAFRLASSNSVQTRSMGMFASSSFETTPVAGGLFGSPPASAPSSGGLFSSSPAAPVGGGLFGSSTGSGASTSGGLFGSSTAPPPPRGGGLFGSSSQAPASGGLFGSSSATGAETTGGLFGSPSGEAFASTVLSTSNSRAPTAGGSFSFGSAPSSASESRSTSSGLFGNSLTSSGRAKQPPAPGGLFASRTASTGAFAAAPPRVHQAAALAAPQSPADDPLLAQYSVDMEDAADLNLIDYSDDDADDSFVSCGEKKKKKKKILSSNGEDVDSSDKFTALVSLQDFSGFWNWSQKLLNILGTSEEDVTKVLGILLSKGDAMATALAVAFLRKKLADEQDSWDMMEEKATQWLQGELGVDRTDKLLTAAESLF